MPYTLHTPAAVPAVISPHVTTWRDDFLTVGKPALRAGWLLYRSPSAVGGGADYYRYDVDANGLVWARQGSAGATPPKHFLLPTELLNSGVYGKSQFVESKVSVTTDNASGMLVANFCGDMEIATTHSKGYGLNIQRAAGVNNFRVFHCSEQAQVLLYTLATAWVVNDVVRLEILQGGASNTITVKLNGVVIDTRADSAATRPNAVGYPGIGIHSMNIGSSMTFRYFEAGIIP